MLRLTSFSWSPLANSGYAQGCLASRTCPSTPEPAHVKRYTKAGFARKEAVVREVMAVAREVGHTPAQVALAWLLERPKPVIPIIGARKLQQVEDNLACVAINLAPAPHRAPECGQPDRYGLPA